MTPKDKPLGRCREATQRFLLPPPASLRCNVLQPSAAVPRIFSHLEHIPFQPFKCSLYRFALALCASHDAAPLGLTSFRPCRTPAKIEGLEGDRSCPKIWGHSSIVCRGGSCAVLPPFIQFLFQTTKNLCFLRSTGILPTSPPPSSLFWP